MDLRLKKGDTPVKPLCIVGFIEGGDAYSLSGGVDEAGIPQINSYMRRARLERGKEDKIPGLKASFWYFSSKPVLGSSVARDGDIVHAVNKPGES